MTTTFDIPANSSPEEPMSTRIGGTGISNPEIATFSSNGPVIFEGDGINPINVSASTANPNILFGGNFSANPFSLGSSFTGVADGQYIADQFRYNKSGAGVVDSSQVSDAPNFAQSGVVSTQSLRLTVTTADASIAAGDLYTVSALVEGYNFLRIAQKDFTVSFWVRSSVTGIHCVAFQNSGADRSYVAEYIIAAANTWQLVSVTIPASPSAGTWSYTNGIGLKMSFSLAAGLTYQAPADAWTSGNYLCSVNQVNAVGTIGNIFAVQLVKIEPGISATSWVQENIASILQNSYRYVRKSYDFGVSPGVNTVVGSFNVGNSAAATGAMDFDIRFGNEMRAIPIVTVYSIAGTSGSLTQSGATEIAATLTSQGRNSFRVTASNNSAQYGGAGHFVANANL